MKARAIIAGCLLLAVGAGTIAGRYLRPATSSVAADSQSTAAAQVQTAEDNGLPIVASCEDGQVLVTPFVENGRQMLRIQCIHGDQSSARVVPASEYSSYASARRQGGDHEARRLHRKRSLAKEILIVGGSAGAGTAIGAVAGGKKGAAIGALSGGVAGLVYDLATRRR